MIFTGKITEIKEIKTGITKKDVDWASLDFEVTESNPHNPDYPQIALFSFFKSGEYMKFAKDFNDYFKLGDEVNVDFNLKCQKYTKDNVEKKFYKTECWKLEKAEVAQEQTQESTTDDTGDGMPF